MLRIARLSVPTLVAPMLLGPVLAGCAALEVGQAADFQVQPAVELPAFGPSAVLQVAMYSQSKSAAASTSVQPDCLLDPGICDVSLYVGGLGRGGVDTYVWLDLDGDDGRDVHQALVDDDLIAYQVVSVTELPYDAPPLLLLDWPEVMVNAE